MVDLSGFNKKIRISREAIDENLPKLLSDSAGFILGRLVDSVINGAPGFVYPKAYPDSVQKGEAGFVGVGTGFLKKSMGIENVGAFERRVTQVFSELAPYHDDMIEWSTEKYGMSFYQITVELYGEEVGRQIVAFLIRASRNVEKGRSTPYQNPFSQ